MVEQQPRHLRGFQHMGFRRQAGQIFEKLGVQETQMGVGVDQARHQGGAATFNHRGLAGVDGFRRRRHLGDPVALDQNLAGKRRLAAAVDHAHIGEQGRCHGGRSFLEAH